MKIFNSLTNEYFDFNTIRNKTINWYCCGPTIYNDSHLGHARTYILFDSIIRYLRTSGYKINYGMNITDIDDKIINKVIHSNNQDSNLNKFNEFIKIQETSFWDDLEALNIQKPEQILRVTDTIPDIINFIEKLILNKFAYIGTSEQVNKSIYFNVEKFNRQFHKTCLDISNNQEPQIKNTHLDDKQNSKDFALWKADNIDTIHWDSGKLNVGNGRPGWHIECSVIMNKMFGNHVDIHSGGIDLKYPHHNNEFCQTTSYYLDSNWIQCFIHSGHLYVDGEKMSQSLGNFTTIKTILKKYSSNEIRLMFLSVKYNQHMDLNNELIQYGVHLNKRFSNFLNSQKQNTNKTEQLNIDKLKNELSDLLNNDFNMPEALKLLNSTIEQIYKNNFEYMNLNQIYEYIFTFLSNFGLIYKKIEINLDFINTIVEIRKEIKEIAQNADKLTKIKLFTLSDKIRDEYLEKLHVKLEDLPNNQIRFF